MTRCGECEGTGTTRTSEESLRWVACPVCFGSGQKPIDSSGRLRRIDQLEKKVSALQEVTRKLRVAMLEVKEAIDRMRNID